VRRIPYGRNLGSLDRTSLEHSHKLLIEINYMIIVIIIIIIIIIIIACNIVKNV
jgi:hypothetical protein